MQTEKPYDLLIEAQVRIEEARDLIKRANRLVPMFNLSIPGTIGGLARSCQRLINRIGKVRRGVISLG